MPQQQPSQNAASPSQAHAQPPQQPQMAGYPGGVQQPGGPPRHYHGIPYLPTPDMNGGMGQLPLVNGSPYPLYAPPNAGPPPMYNNHHLEQQPQPTTSATTSTTTTRVGKNGNGGKKGNGSNGGGSIDGGNGYNNVHPSMTGTAGASPSRQQQQPPQTTNGGGGGNNTMPADMYLPPHANRPPPPHGADYDVLQGLAAIPVLPPGVSIM